MLFIFLISSGQGFGAPPGGAGFSGYPQPPVQSYGGGPAQVPVPGMFQLSSEKLMILRAFQLSGKLKLYLR